jgi:hypothetical protein
VDCSRDPVIETPPVCRPRPAVSSASSTRTISAVGVMLVIDGVAAKHLAEAWAEAPPAEAATALRVVLGEETTNFAQAALFNILYARSHSSFSASLWS